MFNRLKSQDERRSFISRQTDRAIKAKVDKVGKSWIGAPNRYDVEGIDTPGSPRQATPIHIPPRKGMAWFTEVNAKKLAKALKPYVGKEVVVYGGGGSEMNTVKMTDVKALMAESHYYDNDSRFKDGIPKNAKNIEQDKGDPHHFTYLDPKEWIVEPTLHLVGDDPHHSSLFYKSQYYDKDGKYIAGGHHEKRPFTPHLGSWKIAVFK